MGKEFLNSLEYIDGITIVDSHGKIQYSVKYNPDFFPEAYGRETVIGKRLSEAFTNIDDGDSTLYTSMKQKKIIKKNKQRIHNTYGEIIETMNISFPIIINNKTVGAIELSKDITKLETIKKKIMDIDSDILKNQVKADNRLGTNKARYYLEDIISQNRNIEILKEQILHIKNSSAPVFIYGETGTGKELFAHAIHNSSSLREGPFISQNCSAIPENLLESILFGTVKGSYTGAVDAPGLFELADGGTLFLDELDSMPKHLQTKMLRVLEDGYIRRIGGKKEKKSNVRIISASNQNPIEAVQNGTLRQDIYYRLCVLLFVIPPLRERKEDILLLSNFFINKYNSLYQKSIKRISNKLHKLFLKYDWDGNVRELEHIIQYGLTQVSSNDESLMLKHVEYRFEVLGSSGNNYNSENVIKPLGECINELEKKVITQALIKSGGNISKASKIIEIPRQTFSRKMNKYGIKK